MAGLKSSGMESTQGHFVEISLESVLRKASRLEDSLRSCKAKALIPPPDKGRVSSPPPPVPASLPPTPAPSNKELSDQWQKLTAYIVSLEKEVQYYKQLVQDVQSSNANSSGRPAGRTPTSPVGQAATSPAATSPAGQEGPLRVEYWRGLLDEDPENRVLVQVFSYLTVQELQQAAMVCWKWYRVSRHPRLWREVVMSDIMLEPEVSRIESGNSDVMNLLYIILQVLFSLAQWCSCTERVVLHGEYYTHYGSPPLVMMTD